MDRLENLLVRMEAAVTRLELQSKGEMMPSSSARIYQAATELFQTFEKYFVPLSIQIGPAVAKVMNTISETLKIGLRLIQEIYNRLPLTDAQIPEFYQSLTSLCKFVLPPKDYYEHFCRALEKVPDIFFFITDNCPTDFVKEAVSSVEFYNNRVRTLKGHEKSMEWSNILSQMLSYFVKLVDEEFANKKIRFTGTAQSYSLPMGEEKGKIGAPESPRALSHEAKKRPVKLPKNDFNVYKNLHEVEYQEGKTIQLTVQRNHSLNIIGCRDSTIVVNGKLNAVSVHESTGVTVVLQSCISQVDVIRSQNVRLQVSAFAPTFNIENCESVKLFLSDMCQESEILTYHSDCVWIIQLIEKNGEFVQGDMEFEVPSHFQHSWSKKGVKTVPAEACGE